MFKPVYRNFLLTNENHELFIREIGEDDSGTVYEVFSIRNGEIESHSDKIDSGNFSTIWNGKNNGM